jgi:hypothetical protein
MFNRTGSQAAAAHGYVEERKNFGKIVAKV